MVLAEAQSWLVAVSTRRDCREVVLHLYVLVAGCVGCQDEGASLHMGF